MSVFLSIPLATHTGYLIIKCLRIIRGRCRSCPCGTFSYCCCCDVSKRRTGTRSRWSLTPRTLTTGRGPRRSFVVRHGFGAGKLRVNGVTRWVKWCDGRRRDLGAGVSKDCRGKVTSGPVRQKTMYKKCSAQAASTASKANCIYECQTLRQARGRRPNAIRWNVERKSEVFYSLPRIGAPGDEGVCWASRSSKTSGEPRSGGPWRERQGQSNKSQENEDTGKGETRSRGEVDDKGERDGDERRCKEMW
jgi:hypothetical protein